ncbi:MAG: shikimate dehydrogenase, partial [archaeon]
MPEIKIFAVTGNPILHSKSPAMHNAAFRKLRMNAVYTRLLAQNADEALNTAKEIGIKGLNITAPFKEDFVKLAGKIDPKAKKIGAVNTVIFKNSKAIGFNTDIDGISRALKSNRVNPDGKDIVILGAGGAAKATVCALADKADVTILNRRLDFEKAERLAEKFDCKAYSLEDKKMLPKILQETDIIVSCVSTAERIIPSELLSKKMVILDANYSTITALQKDAKQKGCKVIDGREWLLFQGAEAFEIFSGKKA